MMNLSGIIRNVRWKHKAWFVNNIEKDWTILDCGANIGYYTILFAKLAFEGYVYAFEPTLTSQMLQMNLKYNDIRNTTIVPFALGKISGDIEDNIYRIWGDEPEKQIYPFITIDDYIKRFNVSRVDCIKIDVDSFDFEVLMGTRETLLNYNPYLIVELNHALSKRNQSNVEALKWLGKLGYNEAIVFDNDNFLLKRNEKLNKESNNTMSLIFPN